MQDATPKEKKSLEIKESKQISHQKLKTQLEQYFKDKDYPKAWLLCRQALSKNPSIPNRILVATVFYEWYFSNRKESRYLWLAALCLGEGIAEEQMQSLKTKQESEDEEARVRSSSGWFSGLSRSSESESSYADQIPKIQMELEKLLGEKTYTPKELASLSPMDQARFYLYRGHVRRDQKEWEDATKDYQQVIALQATPDSPVELAKMAAMAYRMLADRYGETEQREEELAALKKAVALDPESLIFWHLYGQQLTAHGDYEKAVEVLEEVRRLDLQQHFSHPYSANQTLQHAKDHLRLHQLKAEAEKKPDEPDAPLAYVTELMFHRNFREARPILDKLQESFPDHPKLSQLLAEIPSRLSSHSSSLLPITRSEQLWAAAERGDAQEIKRLRDAGVDMNAQDEAGNTALHRAAAKGNISVIPILHHNHGLLNQAKETPLQVAIRTDQTAMVEALIPHTVARQDILKTMVILKKQSMLRHFLQEKHPDRRSLLKAVGGIRALVSIAIQHHQPEMIAFLLESDPDCRGQCHQTQGLFHEAIRARNEDAMEILWEYFVDPEALNESKETPLVLLNKLLDEEKTALPLKNLKSKLDNVTTRFHDRQEKLLEFVTAVTDKLREELSQEKGWDFLDERSVQTKEARSHWQKMVKECLQEDLTCQRALSASLDKMPLLVKPLKNSFQAVDPKIPLSDLKKTLQKALQTPWQTPEVAFEKTPVREKKKLLTEVPLEDKNLGQLTREQKEFVDAFAEEFDTMYSQFRALCAGAVIHAPDDKDRMAQVVVGASQALPSVSIPVVGVSIAIPTDKAVIAAVTLGQYLRNRWRMQHAERMVHVFHGMTMLERSQTIHEAAVCIAEKYRGQLTHLRSGSQGISKFAQCVANRIIDYIISADKHHIESEASMTKRAWNFLQAWVTGHEIPRQITQRKPIYALFLDGLLRVTNYPSDSEELWTFEGSQDRWTAKGLIENSGVMTPEGERFAHPHCDVENYGYVLGTSQEAEKRGLTTKNPDTQEVWEEGRQFVEATTAGSHSILFEFQRAGKVLMSKGEGVYTEYMTERESHEPHKQNLKGKRYKAGLFSGSSSSSGSSSVSSTLGESTLPLFKK